MVSIDCVSDSQQMKLYDYIDPSGFVHSIHQYVSMHFEKPLPERLRHFLVFLTVYSFYHFTYLSVFAKYPIVFQAVFLFYFLFL